MNETIDSPFHQGEQKIQQRLGVREKMERFGRQVIRDFMPDQHREFYTRLPFIFVAHADKAGFPWASILFNQSGFIESPNDRQLQINAHPVTGDPLAKSLEAGTRLGLLGIELETRRRNRLSAYIKKVSHQGIELNIRQAFGNCPQYIQKRELDHIDPASMPVATTEKISRFDRQAVELIANSDTFFVASHVANGNDAASDGADVSHRGGKTGFVRVDNDKTLTIPDYLGNFHFNTLGNFLENPKAGLLFIDFEKGHILTLTGTVEILWDSPDTKFFAGAERLWQFHVDHGFRLKNVLPLRWKLQEYSPNSILAGNWQEAEASRKAESLRNTWQPYKVVKIAEESSVIKSFYLQAPAEQKPSFRAGQFLTVKADIDGKPCIRTYTVSSSPADEYFRISVKREAASSDRPAGIFSSFLHKHLIVGDRIQVKAPTGSFIFDAGTQRPAVLISAGVGITPMVSMLRHALQEAIRTRSMRSILLICSARNAEQRAFFSELEELEHHAAGQVRVVWALTRPETNLRQGIDYQHHGRISKPLLESLITSHDCEVFLCGNNQFMQEIYRHLRDLGIADKYIFAEAFGVSSLVRDREAVKVPSLKAAKEARVRFTESQLELLWSEGDGSLLEFAEMHGLNPEYGCRSGQCGSCKARLLSGKVCHRQNIGGELNENEVLLCSAVPAYEADGSETRLEIEL